MTASVATQTKPAKYVQVGLKNARLAGAHDTNNIFDQLPASTETTEIIKFNVGTYSWWTAISSLSLGWSSKPSGVRANHALAALGLAAGGCQS